MTEVEKVEQNEHHFPTVVGKNGISATIIADSISPWGKRIITYEIIYPRFIHAEFMTHRLFSRNCASSRAIPTKKMLQIIRETPAIPVYWGRNQAGMQANTENDEPVLYEGEKYDILSFWHKAKESAIGFFSSLSDANYHKQITNRIVEPFQMIKTVVTATEYDNFFWLRNDKMAQPEIQELARCMLEVRKLSVPVKRSYVVEMTKINTLPEIVKVKIQSEMLRLEKDSYHLPYVSDVEREKYDIHDCIIIAVARCAAVSYRNEDYPLEKCKEVYNRLIVDARKHSSAMEHVAQVMNRESIDSNIDMKNLFASMPGLSHIDSNMKLWSGNFQGWIQHRKLIEGECCWDYNYEQ